MPGGALHVSDSGVANMVPKCQQCGHVNDRFGSTRYCDVCGAALPARDAAPSGTPSKPLEAQATTPPAAVLSTVAGPAQPGGAGLSSDGGVLRSLDAEASAIPQPAIQTGAPRLSSTGPALAAPAQPALAPAEGAATFGRMLEGTVIRVDPLGEEPADPDIARILFSLILMVDLVLFLGSLALGLIAVIIVAVVLAAVLRMSWLGQAIMQVVQVLFYVLTPLLQILLPRMSREVRREPVTNYLLRAADGRHFTFRVKGRLQGATISSADRVRVWGRPEHGILRFEGGVKLNTGESLTLPVNWSWLLLGLAVVANVMAYVFLRARVPM